MIDTESEPGAWAKALQAPCSYRTIIEHPGADTLFLAPGTCGAAESDLAAPPLSDRSPFHGETNA